MVRDDGEKGEARDLHFRKQMKENMHSHGRPRTRSGPRAAQTSEDELGQGGL